VTQQLRLLGPMEILSRWESTRDESRPGVWVIPGKEGEVAGTNGTRKEGGTT
jgi:hypothetical protein